MPKKTVLKAVPADAKTKRAVDKAVRNAHPNSLASDKAPVAANGAGEGNSSTPAPAPHQFGKRPCTSKGGKNIWVYPMTPIPGVLVTE